jgi:hypothetical protein
LVKKLLIVLLWEGLGILFLGFFRLLELLSPGIFELSFDLCQLLLKPIILSLLIFESKLALVKFGLQLRALEI